jgi:hypothetical protein
LLHRLLGNLLTDVEEICSAKAYEGHETKGSLPTRYLLGWWLGGLSACCSSLSLLRKCLLRLVGLLSFLGKRFFDGSQSSLQILYSGLCSGSFALFLLECTLLSPFGSTLLLGRVPHRGWFGSFLLGIRRGGCCPTILVVSFIVIDTL